MGTVYVVEDFKALCAEREVERECIERQRKLRQAIEAKLIEFDNLCAVFWEQLLSVRTEAQWGRRKAKKDLGKLRRFWKDQEPEELRKKILGILTEHANGVDITDENLRWCDLTVGAFSTRCEELGVKVEDRSAQTRPRQS